MCEREYLELFGDPKSYEFDEKKIFDKCDKAGVSRVDLHFKMGMSSSKVFRVILYRLSQLFTLNYALYLKKEIEYEALEKSHKKLHEALNLSKKVFNKKTLKRIIDDFENLYILLNHQDAFDKSILNLQVFLYEESFYNSSKGDEPIHFFDKKKRLFKLTRERE